MGAIVSVSGVISGSGLSSATASTWSMLSTKCSFMAVRRFSGTSATSFSFSCGKITSNNPSAMGGQQLLFQSADGQHLAAQRDLAGHGHIAAHRNPAQRARQSGRDGDPRRGTVFWDCALGHMHVNVEVAVEVARQSEPRRLASACTTSPPAPTPASRRPVCRSSELALAIHHRGTSVVRIEPPTSVHARPVTKPISLFSWASVSRNFITPR